MKKTYFVKIISLILLIVILCVICVILVSDRNEDLTKCSLNTAIYHQKFDSNGDLWIDSGSKLIKLESTGEQFTIKKTYELSSYLNELALDDDHNPLAISESTCSEGNMHKSLELKKFASDKKTEEINLLNTDTLKNENYISYKLSPNGKYLAIQLKSGYITIIKIENLEEVYRVDSNVAIGFDINYNPYSFVNEGSLFTYYVGENINIYDIENNKLLHNAAFDYFTLGFNFGDYIFTPDLGYIIFYGGDLKNRVKILNYIDNEELDTIELHYLPSKVSVSNDGNQIVIIANEEGKSNVYLYDIELKVFKRISTGIMAEVSADSELIAISDIDIIEDISKLTIFSLEDNHELYSITDSEITD